MALHKIVNGIKIDLTPEEEAATLAEWEANRIKTEERRAEREATELRKQQARNKIALLAGLTEEEKQLLFN